MQIPPAPILVFALVAGLLAPSPSEGAGWFDGKRYPIVTDENFPADEFILEQARFWFEIYYHVNEDEGLLHDPFHPHLVLRKVKVPADPGRASSKVIDAVLDQLRAEMRAAAAKDPASRTPVEQELMARLPPHWDTLHVQLCTERLRFQRGLRNKFRAGVERSYRYLPLIDSVFSAKGLPNRLKYLPHVESSFYPHAYSKVGAAGMWQFMKSSARHYKMKVGYHVDERRDPAASTAAAAAMLAYNHAYLKTWPLALVAYNHGPGGMARAARETGTRDLTTIIKSYYSNTFGFASKSFYPSFLAASSIALKADSLYPNLAKLEPLRYQRVALPKAMGTRLLLAATGLTPGELEEYNLGLRPATFRSNAQLPKGHVINLPVTLDPAQVAARLGVGAALASLGPASKKSAKPAASESAVATAGPGPATGPGSTEATGSLPATEAAATAAATAVPVPADKVDAPAELPSGSALAQASAPAAPAPAGSATRPASPAADQAGGKAPAALTKTVREAGKALLARNKPKPEAKPPGPGPSPTTATTAELRPAGPAPAEVVSAGKDAARPAEPMAVATSVPAAAPRKETTSLASALAPSAPAATASSPLPAPETRAPAVIDSTFALQVAGLDRLAHPMDRFNPAIYRLEHEYSKGTLTIQVGTEETLSHYAEWAWVPERTLRSLNRIRTAKDLRMGRAIRIPMPQEKAPEFLAKREEYYRAMEEDFYSNYFVSALEPLVVKKGMNLWGLVNEKEIPFWLLQKHNPGRLLGAVRPGDTLSLPLIETGIRKWGFTRYGNSREYLAGITRYILSEKPNLGQ